MNIPVDLSAIEATALVSVRILLFVVIAPPFSYQGIPMQIKGMLAILLGIVVAPQAAQHYSPGSTGQFLLDLVGEATTGAVLGFLVFVVFSAIQSAGSLLDFSGGLQAAQQYDPSADVNAAQFSRLFQMTALTRLFVTDGYQLVLGGLVRSFTAVPLTMSVDWKSVTQTLTGSVTQMLLAALQIAGPIMAVLFVANAALGLLSRVAPALNVYSLGPPALVLLTVVLCAVGIVALPMIVQAVTSQAVHVIGGP